MKLTRAYAYHPAPMKPPSAWVRFRDGLRYVGKQWIRRPVVAVLSFLVRVLRDGQEWMAKP